MLTRLHPCITCKETREAAQTPRILPKCYETYYGRVGRACRRAAMVSEFKEQLRACYKLQDSVLLRMSLVALRRDVNYAIACDAQRSLSAELHSNRY